MNEQTLVRSPGDSSLERANQDPEMDLDAQIHAAELAVIERDERVRRRIESVKDRVRGTVRGKTGIGVALAGVGALVFAKLFGRRRGGAGASRGASMLTALTMLWPLLPAAVRGSSPRALPSILVGLLVPLLGKLFAGGESAAAETRESAVDDRPAPASADFVDPDRYVGTWYEIARLPSPYEKSCAGDVVTDYALTGQENVLAVVNRCRRKNGRTRTDRGFARVVAGSGNAHLKVSFAPRLLRRFPAAWHDYWVLLVDAEYRYALAGTPDRRGLWLLSRTPTLDRVNHERLVEHARAQGYDTASLMLTAQR